MHQNLYNELLKKIKVFENNIIKLPILGEQTKHNIIHIIDDSEKFKLFINKKGHRNPENLTILLNSVSYKSNLIRFDVNGSDHSNPPNYERIPTPHLHFINEEYDYGRIAIPLHEIVDIELIDEIVDALEFFMDYTNIKHENIIIKSKLL